MAKLPSDQAMSDFFGEDVDISSSSYPAGRVAIARDNARLFVGNVNNYYSENPRRDAFSIEDLSITETTMMDPLSFTTSVLAAVTQTADTLRSCQRRAARLRIADLSIASLHTECSTIRLRLNQIQSLMLHDGERQLEDRFEAYVLNEYDDLLQACCLPFSILNRHLESLGITQMKEMDRATLRGKLHDMWAYSQMEMICHAIGSLARAIGILSSAFQSDTATKAVEIMRSPESKRVLASISNDAVSLQDSFLAAHGTQEESIRDSVIMDQVSDFDNVLKNTELYRKAFLRQMIRSQTTKLEIAPKAAATSSSVPGKPRKLPVPIESGLTVIPSNLPSSRKGPGDSSLGEGWPDAGTNLYSAASDRELTLVPIQRTNPITILPNLTQDHPRFQQMKPGQVGRRNSVNSQTSDDTILPSDLLSTVSPVEDQESILAPIHRTDHITNPPYLKQKQSKNVFKQVRANQDERRNSIESRTADDMILWNDSVSRRASVDDISAAFTFSSRLHAVSSHYYRSPHSPHPANGQGLLPVSNEIPLWLSSVFPSPEVFPNERIMDSWLARESAASEIAAVEPKYDDPSSSPSSALLRSSRLPTLSEVLGQRTVKPYSLFEFILYMRDIRQSLNYLYFWLDVEQHYSLCRHHVPRSRRDFYLSYRLPLPYVDDGNDVEEPNIDIDKTVARSAIKASAWMILQTFFLPGSEREIVLPEAILGSITHQIRFEGRDDPGVFDGAKDYVFQLMEKEAFPGFLNLGKPVFRMFRKSKSLGGLVNKIALRGRY